MSGLIARVQLVSNALLLLGDRPIASLTEGTTGSTLGANLFENTYLSMLQNHRWRFAVKTQSLSKLTATPKTNYQYAFQLPSEFLYAVKGDSRMFEVYMNEIHANASTFQLDYVQRIEEDLIPAYFAKALEYNLAFQFAVPLTGDMDKGTYYQRLYIDALRKAKMADSSQYPEKAVQDAPYIDARW